MPYIKQEDRKALERGEVVTTSGELNFAITQLLVEYLNINGLKYKTINDIVGALEGAKMEFYRRVATPYENAKIEENGDVYDGFAPPIENKKEEESTIAIATKRHWW